MIGLEAVAEGMGDHLVVHDATCQAWARRRMPSNTPRCFEDGLHGFHDDGGFVRRQGKGEAGSVSV